MKYWCFFSFLFLLLMGYPVASFSMSIDEALSLSRKNSYALKEQLLNVDKATSEHEAIDAAFDFNTFANARYADDHSEPTTNPFMGESRTQLHYDIGVKKMFSTGTITQLTASHARSEIDMGDRLKMPIGVSSNPMMAQMFSGMMSMFSPEHNPMSVTRIELQVIQNLWRNFNASEIKLIKDTASMGVIQSKYTSKIMQQAVQFETEILYWQLSALSEKLKVQKQLIQKAKEFAKLMSQRVKLGRADPVDQATADSMLISQETILLNLEVAYSQLEGKLVYSLNPEGGTPKKVLKLTSNLEDIANFTSRNKEQLLEVAYKQRYDLALIKDSLKPLEAKRHLAQEEAKPTLALFGSAAYTGVEDKFSDSLNESIELKHPTYGVGLKFEMSLNGTKAYNEHKASVLAISSLNMKKLKLESDIKRDVELSYDELLGAERLITQNKIQTANLDKKHRGERAKLKQVRSEMVVVIRYEMELLAASHDRISAFAAKRQALSKLKFLQHSYLTE